MAVLAAPKEGAKGARREIFAPAARVPDSGRLSRRVAGEWSELAAAVRCLPQVFASGVCLRGLRQGSEAGEFRGGWVAAFRAGTRGRRMGAAHGRARRRCRAPEL